MDESGQNGLEEDAYTDMLLKICKKVGLGSSRGLRNYGANCTDLPYLVKRQCLGQGGSNQKSCTRYNKMVVNQCAGQHSYGQVGLGRFGINCTCKFLRTYFKFILNNKWHLLETTRLKKTFQSKSATLNFWFLGLPVSNQDTNYYLNFCAKNQYVLEWSDWIWQFLGKSSNTYLKK